VERLPEGTIIPEGARTVSDFYSLLTVPNWAGRTGVTFRSGYRKERITNDACDFGRIIELNADDDLGPEARIQHGVTR
jgi:hypothetical protein